MATNSQRFMEITLGVVGLFAILFLALVLVRMGRDTLFPEPKPVIPKGQLHCECYQRGEADVAK